MIKILLYGIVTIALFPFSGHLAALTFLSTLLIIAFSYKIIKGTVVLNQYDYTKNRYFFVFMISLFIYSIVSIFWIADVRGWMNYNVYLFIATVSLIVCNYVLNTIEDFYEMFHLISIYSIIHNVIGWINVITGEYILSSSPLIPDFREKGNPLSLFNNTNDFATFLVFSIFLNIILIKNTSSRFNRKVFSINIFSSSVLLYLTMSRANYLALILGMIAFVFLISKRKRTIYLLSVLLLTTGTSFYAIPTAFGAINSFFVTNVFNSGDVIRVNLIKNGFSFLKDSFGFGIGAGNIAYYLENNSMFYISTIYTLHNWWLDILITYGVIFFILYLVYYGKLLANLYKMKNTSNTFVRYTSISFLSILVSYFIGSTSSSSNFPIMWIWILFSIMISFLSVNVEGKMKRTDSLSFSNNDLQ